MGVHIKRNFDQVDPDSSYETESNYSTFSSSNSTASHNNSSSRPTKRRRKWDKHEDKILRQVVSELQVPSIMTSGDPKISWSAVAKRIPNRSAKQCRDRWNSITPGIKKREWTKEEDDLLLRMYLQHKNSWVRIAKEFQGRNDNMLKSRFRSLCKRPKVKEFLAQPYAAAGQLRPTPTVTNRNRKNSHASSAAKSSAKVQASVPSMLPGKDDDEDNNNMDNLLGGDIPVCRSSSIQFESPDNILRCISAQSNFSFGLGPLGLMDDQELWQPSTDKSDKSFPLQNCASDYYQKAFPDMIKKPDDDLADWCAFMVDQEVL